MMFFFKRKKEERAEQVEVDSLLLSALLNGDSVNRQKALEIPTVQACVNVIANCVSMIPIKLYEEVDGEVKEITNDRRTNLLNKDTGDTLTGTELKKLWVMDYLLGKGAYTYIQRNSFGEIQALYYTNEAQVTINSGIDPIFKKYTILVNGQTYYPHDFLKICRNSCGKGRGKSIVEENRIIMAVSYNQMKLENGLVKKGGNKKGYLESENQLGREEIDRLKNALGQLYSNSSDVSENVVVLNRGVKFHESSATSVELQLNESKQTNSTEICKLFNVPPEIIFGKATETAEKQFFKICIAPIFNIIEAALDSDLLYEQEKGKRYFAFDDKELTRGSIIERYRAYALGLQNNFLQIDEVREREDLKPLGVNYIKLGLQDVLYDPEEGTIYTPNTNKMVKYGETTLTDDNQGDIIKNGKRANPYRDYKTGRFTYASRMSRQEYVRVSHEIATNFPNLTADGKIHTFYNKNHIYRFKVIEFGLYHFISKKKSK